jgi:hypothetical protein
LSKSSHTVEVDHHDVCYIRAPYEPELRRAIRAIPGRYWDSEERLWRIRLGPDRAEAVARLMGHFPRLRPVNGTVGALAALRAQRNLASPGIETVVPDGLVALSICDDVEHPVLDDLKRSFDFIRYPEIGRIAVPITAESRADLSRAVSQPGVRVHPRARGQLDRPAPHAVVQETPAWQGSAWQGWVSTAVVDGKPWFVFATRRGIPAAELASAPGLRPTSEGVCALPMDGAHRELVERVLARNRMMLVDRRTLRSLDHLDPARPDDPPPSGVVTVDHDGDVPQFRIQMLWDEDVLDTLTDLPESRLLLDSDARYGLDRERIDGSVVADASTAGSVDEMVRKHALALDDEARDLLAAMLEEQGRGEELVELSQAHGVEFEPPAALTGELMPFQAAGVVYALRQRRVFIADEQGLGKTVQALATIEADGAYPAVVVCPASLKLNWLREIERWLPGRTAAEVSGRRGALPATDIVVVNYDVLDARVDALAGMEPRALVFDESHYCKNPKARRTKALIKLSERIAPDALRLALTGTPLVNQPAELVPQLRALRRLDHFGSGRSFARRFRGEEARRRLHWHLRSSCYVRRRKDEVLTQLPPKRRITVPVPLTNEAAYQQLERDLIAWLRSEVHDPRELEQRIDTALRAEALVKLNALRHVAAKGKLAAATEWIEAFIESGERLVVFAHHRDIQHSLLESFPDAARILGTDTLVERDANVERFQASHGPHLCICSLEAASHGFTLTAAASVAFVELGWTPAKHEQAEDRVHRIGQERHVTAWYLLAADTIDERIAALIDHKRAVVGSVTDGTAGAEGAVVDRLLRELAADALPPDEEEEVAA